MQTFIIEIENYNKIKNQKFYSPQNLSLNTIILFKSNLENKIYGIYKIIQKENKGNNFEYKFTEIKKFRRGIEINKLKLNNINIGNKKIIKITSEKYNKILNLLNEINFPQLASDLLIVSYTDKKLKFNFISSYPELNLISSEKSIDLKFLWNTFSNLSNIELKNDIKKYGLRIYNLINENFLNNLKTGRDIAIYLDKKISFLPFEIAFDSKNFLIEKYNIARIFYKNSFQTYPPILNYENEVAIIAPKYNNQSFEYSKISKILNSKSNSVAIFNKKLSKKEFIKILENSKILYFAGHSNFNKKDFNYYLKLSNTDSLSLEELKNSIQLPEFIIFHSCFENKYFNCAENQIKDFFKKGTKNILIPFTEIPQDNLYFISNFLKNLTCSNKIGESFRFAVIESILNNNYDWIYFRLYGDPKLKYF